MLTDPVRETYVVIMYTLFQAVVAGTGCSVLNHEGPSFRTGLTRRGRGMGSDKSFHGLVNITLWEEQKI